MGLFNSIRAFFLGSACANLPPEKLADGIVAGISARPDALQLSDALMVRLANRDPVPITMYGRQVVDTLPNADPQQRLSYDIQPFSHMSAGAGTVIICQDASGEDYVLLGKRPEGTKWGLPAGYMSVTPSLNAQGIYSEDIGHKRDHFEAELDSTGKRIADEPMNTLSRSQPSYDKTLEDTAIRETREESGVELRRDQLQFVSSEVYDMTGQAQPRQNQTNYYLADLRAEKALRPITATDDLKDPEWVKLSELQNGKDGLSLRGMPIVHGAAIEKAITLMREKEYASFGVTKEAIANFSHLPTPTSAIGEAASAWHKNALSIAATMKAKLEQPAFSKGPSTGYGLSA